MEKAFQNPNTRKQRNNSIVPMDRGVDNSFKGYGLSKIDVYTKNAIKARQLQRFEVPNYTTTERDGMQAQKGKLIYNSTTDALNYYDGTTWQALGAGGGGETNTASNVGTGGVGLYKQKTGVDLEFKNINAGSSKVSISNDAGNNEVDIDVDESNFDGSLITSVNASQLGGQAGAYYLNRTNHTGTQTASTISDFDAEVSNNADVSTNTLKRHDAMTVVDGTTIDFTLAGQVLTGEVIEGAIDHDNLFNTHNLTTDINHTAIQNIGTNTHAQIDTHIASTTNPHSVDIDDVTPTTTKGDIIVENGSNAVRLAIGSNGDVLTADSTESTGIKWEAIPDSSGWLISADTWNYASTTTFTVSGDKTGELQVGDKIKLTNNSTVKYYYISAISYSSPNTTVTLAGEVDLANSAITSNYTSKLDNPQGFKKGENYYRINVAKVSLFNLANASETKFQMDVENFDTNGDYDNATNYYWTCPVSGYYLITAEILVVGGTGLVYLAVKKNGSTNLIVNRNDNVSGQFRPIGTGVFSLAKGDTIQLNGYQSTGATRQATGSMTIQFQGI